MNKHLLRMYLFEPLMLLAVLIAVCCYILKLRLKLTYLALKLRYTAFKVRRVLKQRRDTLAENRVYRDRLQKIPEGVGRAHCFPGFSWNVAHPNQPNL